MSMSFEPGAPVKEGMIPLCAPVMAGNEWVYIKDCLDSGWVSSVGTYVDRFEQDMAARVGTHYAIATNTGTAALHIALLAAGIQPEDEVIISTLTFIAPANAIRYAGAYPIFIDADPATWEIDPAKVAEFLETACDWRDGELRNRITGRRVTALMPVHILGHPVDMDPLLKLAEKFNLIVIEDATESLGATYKHRKVGHLGQIACLSFNGNKLMTTGGGGMILTDNPAWAKRARYLTTQAKDDPLEYIHHEIGYNYRLTNIQAAMGCAQLEALDDYIAAKKRIARTYQNAFKGVEGLTPMPQAAWAESVFWMYTVLIDPLDFGMDSRALLRHLAAYQIQARPLWQPLHQSRAFADVPARHNPIADDLNARALSLPCSVNLSPEQQQYVIETILSSAR